MPSTHALNAQVCEVWGGDMVLGVKEDERNVVPAKICTMHDDVGWREAYARTLEL